MDRQQRIRVPCELSRPMQRVFRQIKALIEKPHQWRLKRSQKIAKKVMKAMKAKKISEAKEEARIQRMHDRAARMGLKGLQEEVVALWLHNEQQDKAIAEQKQEIEQLRAKSKLVMQQELLRMFTMTSDRIHDCMYALHDRLHRVEIAVQDMGRATTPAAAAAAVASWAPAEESLFDDES
jgi:hypothetical protein